jgi:dynein light chain 1
MTVAKNTSKTTSSSVGKKKSVQDCASALKALGLLDDTSCDHIDLSGQYPPISIMDPCLGLFHSCHTLSLSSNNIEKIQNLSSSMPLKILSLGRNTIKKLDGVQAVAGTLEQLWISYNAIDKLSGVEQLVRLQTLYMSNNKITDWEEIDRLSGLPELTDVLFVGNPIHSKYKKANNLSEYKEEMMKRLPHLKKLDGRILAQQDPEEQATEEQATNL